MGLKGVRANLEEQVRIKHNRYRDVVIMNGVSISDHTAHIISSLVSICDYFLGCLLDSTESQCVTVSLESLDCEFWCNFDTHCLSGHITVGISLGRCVMNGVISDHTAHI